MFRRRCVTTNGTFEAYVSGGSSLKVLAPGPLRIERPHQRFIDQWVRPDAVIWDIGANMGLFAFPAALKARRGKVYAFEPDVDIYAQLRRSVGLSRNAGLDLSLFCLAISDEDGTARFQIAKYSRAMNKLEAVGRWNDDQVRVAETRSVTTARIDTLIGSLKPPSIIKIDVEGAEVRVLVGGEATIAKYRPLILIEGPSELWQPMGDFFRKHDYVMLDGADQRSTPLDHPVWDTVAIPRETHSR